jgi:alkylation response protein AidB-like acyl-CoA dehydrogenase
LLTQAGVNALAQHGSPELQRRYLPKMVSGEWTGSMQLTEPQAGSDLRFLRTKAVPAGDGSYRIIGGKIFITYGEHPMTDNIIHLMLARLPDAPPGTKGISLFLVPKFLLNEDGSLGARNDAFATKLEHKLGIHGSPTCVMAYGENGGAVGWLVGEPHQGLQAMFTMMIEARVGVGSQGVGIAERAYQQALNYARERIQGRGPDDGEEDSVAIIHHPEVARMLLSMKAKIAAARAICYRTAALTDRAHHNADAAERRRAQAEAALLTPVAKAFGSDIGVEVASEGIQVHGGMGYIEETGAGQMLRDARIAPIYEGANGIQAVDLITRKIGQGKGEVLRGFLDGLKQTVRAVKGSNEPSFGEMGERLEAVLAALKESSEWLLRILPENRNAALAGATPYQRLFGIATGGVWLAEGALAAARQNGRDGGADAAHIITARHFAESLAGEADGLKFAITRGHETVAQARAALQIR